MQTMNAWLLYIFVQLSAVVLTVHLFSKSKPNLNYSFYTNTDLHGPPYAFRLPADLKQ